MKVGEIMNRIVTILSCFMAVPSFLYIFNQDTKLCLACGFISLIVLIIAYTLEDIFKTKGTSLINKIVYHVTKNDKKYNYKSRHITYSFDGNNKYSCKKVYEIYPTCKNLDCISDRFAWSAPSAGAKILPTEHNHEIGQTWQQDMWTCYSVCFDSVCRKHNSYKVGSIVDNLIDDKKIAVPYLSTTIDRKTETLTMIIKIPKTLDIKKACFKIYNNKNALNETYSETLEYNDSVGGFKSTIDYPRKGWKYVISW